MEEIVKSWSKCFVKSWSKCFIKWRVWATVELFNEYFVNIAQNIGTNDPILHGDTVSSITTQYENHSSIELIKDHTMGAFGEFNFQCVSSDVIMSLLNKLNIRKAVIIFLQNYYALGHKYYVFH